MEKASPGYQAKSCAMSGKRRATWSRRLVGRSSIQRAQPALACACILRRDNERLRRIRSAALGGCQVNRAPGVGRWTTPRRHRWAREGPALACGGKHGERRPPRTRPPSWLPPVPRADVEAVVPAIVAREGAHPIALLERPRERATRAGTPARGILYGLRLHLLDRFRNGDAHRRRHVAIHVGYRRQAVGADRVE